MWVTLPLIPPPSSWFLDIKTSLRCGVVTYLYEYIQMVNRHMKRCSASPIIRKMQTQNHKEILPHICLNGYYQKVCVCSVMFDSLGPHGPHRAPLSMQFSRQEYWIGLLFPFLGNLLDLEIEPMCLSSPALVGRFFYHCTTWGAPLSKREDNKCWGVVEKRDSCGLLVGMQNWCSHLVALRLLLYHKQIAAKLLQSCLTLCDPIDGSPPGSSIHGIFQARALEWGATAFSTNKLGDPQSREPCLIQFHIS